MLEFRLRRPLSAVLLTGLLALAACDDEESIAPLTPAIVASTATGDTLRGLGMMPLPQDLSVRVTSSDGRPVPGVAVAWAVTAGGGSVSDDTTRTGPDGVASTTWTIGPDTESAQTVVATVASLSAVSFVAKATAPEFYGAAPAVGDNQSGLPGEQLLDSVGVRVVTNDLQPIAGVTVTWQVIEGGGTVGLATSVTDANGIARTSWTLGGTGPQVLGAVVPGIPTPVLLQANTDPCGVARVLALPLNAVRSLEATADCVQEDGTLAEFFTVTAAAPQNILLALNTTAFQSRLVVTSGDDTVVVVDSIAASSGDGQAKLFLGPGTYGISVISYDEAGGAYTLTTTPATTVVGCEPAYITKGASFSETVEATDCATSDPYYSDQFSIWLNEGDTVDITLTSTEFDAYLLLIQPDGSAPAADGFQDDSSAGGTNARIQITASQTGYHIIDAGTFDTNEVGDYTLTIAP